MTILLWVTILCFERSLEYKSVEPSRSYESMKRALEKSVPDLVVSLKSAEARKDLQATDNALWQLAMTNWQLNKFDLADLYLQRLLAFREKGTSVDDMSLVPVLEARGRVQRDWGKFDRSAHFFERAQQIHKRADLSSELAKDINNLGVVSLLDGLSGDAQAMTKALSSSQQRFDRALALCNQLQTGDSITTSILLNNKAIEESASGDLINANALISRARQIRQTEATRPVR